MNRACVVLGCVVLTACPQHPVALAPATHTNAPPEPAGKDHVHGASGAPREGIPDVVQVSPTVKAAVGIKTESAKMMPLSRTVELAGEVAGDPDRTAHVAARASGRVTQVMFKEGDLVKQGATLVVLESAELARARAAVTTATARAAAGEQTLKRVKHLVEQGLAPQQELHAAQAEAHISAAEVLAAQQALGAFGVAAGDVGGDAARLVLRAPVGGTVTMRNAVVGQAVGAQDVLATVVDLTRAYFEARVFERDLASVEQGSVVEVRLHAYPDTPLLGTVAFLGAEVDRATQSILARVRFQQGVENLLKLGLFGNARVATGTAQGAPEVLTVPLSAVTRVMDRDLVFVARPDGSFAAQKVTLGQSAGGRVHVRDGLALADQVAVEGVFNLKSILLKSTFAEEE